MKIVLDIAVSLLPSLRIRERSLLRAQIDSPAVFLNLVRKESLERMAGKKITRDINPAGLLRESERISNWCFGHKSRIVCWNHACYPQLLREIYDPPWLFYVQGTLPPAEIPAAAVVGTRKSSQKARRAARALGREAAELSVPIISGLAVGIDYEVQKGASEGGGRSWGVLGSGFSCFYPASSEALSEQITAEGGGVISEFHPFHRPGKWTFPARNRIISGLSRAVCLIEAPEKSGALITADFALEQGRDLYVHAAGLSGLQGAGTKKLADDGAPILSSMKEVVLDWQLH